jgi:hypothetical protein
VIFTAELAFSLRERNLPSYLLRGLEDHALSKCGFYERAIWIVSRGGLPCGAWNRHDPPGSISVAAQVVCLSHGDSLSFSVGRVQKQS